MSVGYIGCAIILAGTLVLTFGVPYIMYRIWIIRMRKQILRRMEVENAEMHERLSRDFPAFVKPTNTTDC